MPRRSRATLTLAEEGPHSPTRRRVGALLTLVLVGVVGVAGYHGVQRLVHAVSGEQCEVTAAGSTFTWAPDQASNAAAITAIAVQRGLPPRAASIAIATAMQESKVRNVRFGDRDSLGLFQQRPSQGWGTAEQILDPEYSTNTFYDELVKVDGYTDMEIADAAQAVQRSAAGSAYAQHEAQARATASVLSGQTAAGMACALRDPETPGSAPDLAALLEKDFGISGEADGTTVRVRTDSGELAWAVASWAVARATDTGALRVGTHGREWARSMEDSALTWASGGSTGERDVVIHLA
ncbi:hypothetical protein H9L10_09620 [Phycicoccus endophyticus]|uniref:Heavy metal transporter n=1 Tax=Phycicoccus endophyticus TaxID=1690220 RepID=A0A7G9QZ02_9MICO|nr:hypothetical protein [Phycicoccus endophyticus]NHI18915.1 hypothetical protein [Phycicoccus endophyticus]QNN48577.1 hypothetical protein H9L10_09620 [Phycicoccus endophyticus]GGL31364.1 hypothetical protein GCM10012283_12120 [Phycicoccus endophyticus]